MRFDRRQLLAGAAALGASGVTRAFAASGRAGTLARLSAYMDQHRADWGLPGLVLCMVDRAGRAEFLSSGLADVDKKVPTSPTQLFQIGSITKMMTCMAIWSQVDDGKLSPDAPLKDLLPGVAIKDGEDVTLQHLMNHTSGLPGGPPLFSPTGLWSGFKPGTQWTYSNAGYDLVGLVAARTDGKPFPEVVEARVLRPLGMKNSVGGMQSSDRLRYAQGYQPTYLDRVSPRPAPLSEAPWVDSDSGAGCVASTAEDMALFLKFMIGLAAGKGGPVFSDATAKRFLADPAEGWGPGSRYGNGVARVKIDGRRYLHHTGGMVSFSSALHVDPAAGVAAFASANVSYLLGYRPRDVTTFACSLMRAESGGKAPQPKPTQEIYPHPEKIVGAYKAQNGGAFTIEERGDELRLKRGGADHLLQPAGALFATTDPAFPLGLVFDFEDEAAARAWAGGTEYVRDPSKGYKPRPDETLRALAGRYDNDDPWQGSVWIVARDGGLWLNNTDPLFKRADGTFRVGTDEWSPERVAFEGEIDGKPQVMRLSGSPFVRRFG